METIYTVKAKNSEAIWSFKYDLNGDLTSFKILSGTLSSTQKKWLCSPNFPVDESIIIEQWIPQLKKNFEIQKGKPDLSFENFWNLYDNKKGKRKMCQNIWKRLSEAEKIEVFLSIPKYKNYLRHFPNQQMAYPSTYLNQLYYKNDWKI